MKTGLARAFRALALTTLLVLLVSGQAQSAAARPQSNSTLPTLTSSGSVCGTWNIISSPNPGTSTNELYGVTALSANNVWAGGDYQGSPAGTLVEFWNGTSWVAIPSPNSANGDGTLRRVKAISTDDIWAVGDYANQRTLTEHWDGTSWSLVTSIDPTSYMNALYGVEALATNDAWAVGYYLPPVGGGPYTLIEHWNGATWSKISSPNVNSNGTLYAVSGVASDDVWAVGRYSLLPRDFPLFEHWDGTSWSVVPGPDPGGTSAWLVSVKAISANDVWAVGHKDSHGLIMHWNGSQWSVVPSPSDEPVSSGLNDVAAVSGSDVWAVGWNKSLVEHWDGASWSLVPGPNPGQVTNTLYGVAAVSSNDIWAVGYYYQPTVGAYQTLVAHYSSPSTCMAVPDFKQDDGPWASTPIADKHYSCDFMKNKGCAVTSVADVLSYFGATINGLAADPGSVNQYLGSIGGFADCNIRWDYLSKLTGSTLSNIPSYHSLSERETAINKALSANPPELPVISVYPSPQQMDGNHLHYIMITGNAGTDANPDYIINDPLSAGIWSQSQVDQSGKALSQTVYGTVSNLASRNYLQTIIIHRPGGGVPPRLSMYSQSPIQVLVTDPSGNQTGYNPATETYMENIPGSTYDLEGGITNGIGNSTPNTLYFHLDNPANGTYKVQIIGTGAGTYTLVFVGTNQSGVLTTNSQTGQTGQGQIQTTQVTYSLTTGLVNQLFLPLIKK